ncbi:uncharacterized protein APUU_50215S [Aspergillus puulaauensis]|uniref:NAD(P)-binding domain-containing protein n=1 Tax=Aspergillus puulaauensis TaxID=1220207 RepID=A0A7R7XQE7_9EURO|nr:uncharacterized protein APUU_50215S [Aspergillus puulaauensis]BCS25504.1 hypothetical protein APUU_50215S [Aspergillus puulaauensis]
MVKVAVAGGTGGVGRTIFEVLSSSSHQGFVLSRRPSSDNAPIITVDYDNIDDLTAVLESWKIHTVISAFAVEGDSLSKAQANLIEAAKQSKETKRFIPSSFAIPYPQNALQVLPQLKDYFDAIETLQKSDLEWTVFHNGIFLDYFGGPAMKSYLKPNVFVIDIANKVAAIPGDGNAPVTFTYTFDLAKFIVASLSLEKWPQESKVIGDEMTWNEFVSLVENTLDCKFKVHYDSVDKLKAFEITELPGHRALYEHFPKKAFAWFMSIFELFTTDGQSCISKEGSLNDQFPHIKPLTVKGMLEQYWKAD